MRPVTLFRYNSSDNIFLTLWPFILLSNPHWHSNFNNFADAVNIYMSGLLSCIKIDL